MKLKAVETKEEMIEYLDEIDEEIREKPDGERDALILIRKKVNSQLREIERDCI